MIYLLPISISRRVKNIQLVGLIWAWKGKDYHKWLSNSSWSSTFLISFWKWVVSSGFDIVIGGFRWCQVVQSFIKYLKNIDRNFIVKFVFTFNVNLFTFTTTLNNFLLYFIVLNWINFCQLVNYGYDLLLDTRH